MDTSHVFSVSDRTASHNTGAPSRKVQQAAVQIFVIFRGWETCETMLTFEMEMVGAKGVSRVTYHLNLCPVTGSLRILLPHWPPTSLLTTYLQSRAEGGSPPLLPLLLMQLVCCWGLGGGTWHLATTLRTEQISEPFVIDRPTPLFLPVVFTWWGDPNTRGTVNTLDMAGQEKAMQFSPLTDGLKLESIYDGAYL